MIQLDDASHPLDGAFLQAPGGFAWWYLEIINEKGDGLVLIWSFGLPFLPGYASSARNGSGQRPEHRPSLNVAIYEAGELSFYVLHEFRPEDASWDGAGRWTFGDTTIEQVDDEGSRFVDVHLDCPMRTMTQSLTGRIRLTGRIPHLAAGAEQVVLGERTHLWTPQTGPAFATALLDLAGQRKFRVSGRAYHDRNGSARGLDDLGIKTWVWGHTSTPEQERIFYLLWPEGGAQDTPECVGFEMDADGMLTPRHDLRVTLGGAHKTFYGMPTWKRLTLWDGQETWFDVALEAPVDDGPFYLRYVRQVSCEREQRALGSVEVIVPSRIDMARHRFLVRMRVSTDNRPNSFWLPLFQGALSSRYARMLQRMARPWEGAQPQRLA